LVFLIMIINGTLNLENCKNLETLGKLKKVKTHVYLENCENLKDLGELNYVGGVFRAPNCKNLKSLGNLTQSSNPKISLDLSNCIKLTDIGNIRESGFINLENCKLLKTLGNLKIVHKILNLKGSGITKEYIKKEKPWLLDKCNW